MKNVRNNDTFDDMIGVCKKYNGSLAYADCTSIA